MTYQPPGCDPADDQPAILIEQPPPPAGPMPPPPPPLPTPPDSRSPSELVIAEATCLRVLVRCYGWTWLEEGVLRRTAP